MSVTPNRYLLLGAGDLAREVAELLRSCSSSPLEIAAFCDIPGALAAEFSLHADSPEAAVSQFSPDSWLAIGCLGSPQGRSSFYTKFSAVGYRFATVLHPQATVSTSDIGPGCIVFPGARVAIGCQLGPDILINYNATIGHDTILGAHTVVSPGVQLGGRIVSGERVNYGIGSSVLPRRTLGDDAVVGAGSSVWTNVAAGATMVGVPASSRQMPGRQS